MSELSVLGIVGKLSSRATTFVFFILWDSSRIFWRVHFSVARRKIFCPATLKGTPQKIREEYHKMHNRKVVALDESFPMVPRTLNSDIVIKSYRKNTERLYFLSITFLNMIHFTNNRVCVILYIHFLIILNINGIIYNLDYV